ncbi:VOC family protein [Tsukamurella soli]|uniref:VOC family protein n=1 Tax=Tsukamurella soli TaxID=644556 RepID=A0ABP8JLQ8_9ACTN
MAVGQLASISIDCPDPDVLAGFYSALLGLTEAYARPDRSVICLAGAGPMLTLMQVADHAPPAWPDGAQRQQMHIDVAVDELEESTAAAVALGATVARAQPGDGWRVLLDPAGHPFCLSTVRP